MRPAYLTAWSGCSKRIPGIATLWKGRYGRKCTEGRGRVGSLRRPGRVISTLHSATPLLVQRPIGLQLGTCRRRRRALSRRHRRLGDLFTYGDCQSLSSGVGITAVLTCRMIESMGQSPCVRGGRRQSLALDVIRPMTANPRACGADCWTSFKSTRASRPIPARAGRTILAAIPIAVHQGQSPRVRGGRPIELRHRG